MDQEITGRVPNECRNWSEVFLNPHDAAGSRDSSESVVSGHSVLLFHDIASPAECNDLLHEATAAAAQYRRSVVSSMPVTRVRMPVLRYLTETGQALCDALLVRALELLEIELPSLHSTLSSDRGHTCTILGNPEFTFAAGEPAINAYTVGGHFEPHEDKQSLTFLFTLSSPDEFSGGGTGFWSTEDSNLTKANDPTFVLSPLPGTVIVFGGSVTHAGQIVTSGERCVFVCSLSLKDTAEKALEDFMASDSDADKFYSRTSKAVLTEFYSSESSST